MIIYLLYPFCRLWYYYRGLKFNHALYRGKTFNRGSKFIINESQNSLKAQSHLQHWLLIINTFGIKAEIFINLSLLAIACYCLMWLLIWLSLSSSEKGFIKTLEPSRSHQNNETAWNCDMNSSKNFGDSGQVNYPGHACSLNSGSLNIWNSV